MKLFQQQPFLLLPSRFLLMGLSIYIGLELLGSFVLQNISESGGNEQAVIIVMRLFELIAFALLTLHFRLVKNIGLSMPGIADIQVFTAISVVCILSVAALYLIQSSWLSYLATPAWLQGLSGLFLMVVLAPIVEELVFRGLLYRMLREQWGITLSVIVSAVFFSLLHHGLIISPQLAGGVIFALAYEWSRSLWVSIALHMGANAGVYSLSFLVTSL